MSKVPIGGLVIRRWRAGPNGETEMRAVLQRVSVDEGVCVNSAVDATNTGPFGWNVSIPSRKHEIVDPALVDGFMMLLTCGQRAKALRLIGLEPAL